MMINPIIKNECKVGVRNWKFPLMVTVYILIISATTLYSFISSTKYAYFEGLQINESLKLYLLIAVVQSIMLLFIVPSMSSTAISSEQEKQTLEVLISTKMSTLSIVVGKLVASVSKVILLLILTLPVYALSFLIGGVSLSNILQLLLFFIITTFFIGAIGIFFSTFIRSSKAATTCTYFIVLLIIGAVIVAAMVYNQVLQNSMAGEVINIPKIMFLSPLTALLSLLINQLGIANLSSSNIMMFTTILTIPGIENAIYYSEGFMIISTIVLVYLSSVKLNPLNRKKKRKNSNFSNKDIQ